MKAKLADYDMAFVGGWYSLFLLERDAAAEFEAARDHIAMVKGAGTDIFIVCECTRTVHGDEAAPLGARPVMKRRGMGRFPAAPHALRRAPRG